MGEIRRGGFVFVTCKGDYSPYPVHVYRDGTLVVKWDLEDDVAMKGEASRKVLRLIAQPREEELL
jgi:hypothetical protein